jgi:hypothetical protein
MSANIKGAYCAKLKNHQHALYALLEVHIAEIAPPQFIWRFIVS